MDKGWEYCYVSGKQCLCSKNSVVLFLLPSVVLILWVATAWVVLTSVSGDMGKCSRAGAQQMVERPSFSLRDSSESCAVRTEL